AKIEDSLQTRRRELTSLSRIAQELASAADEARVLERVVAIIHETFEARAAWVMLRDDPGGPLRLRNYRGAGPEPPSPVLPGDPGLVGETLRSLAPVFRADLRGQDRVPPLPPPAHAGRGPAPPRPPGPAAGPTTLLCVPLV